MEVKNCGNCEHFARVEGTDSGQCKERPPVPMFAPHPSQVMAEQGAIILQSVYPPVDAIELCGAYSDAPCPHKPIPRPSPAQGILKAN